ncbi:MAG: alpha/beta hydrolase [Planctomycetia bacterium]|nr:MAG: alpha/beta hydrolase [Planctomycetia bacterium]
MPAAISAPRRYAARMWSLPLPRRCLKAAATLVVLYLVYLGGMYVFQERVIFPGAYWRSDVDRPVAADATQVWITSDDGTRVEAWYLAGRGRSAESPGPAMLFFHGNLDVIADRWNVAQLYANAGISALLMEYRGYGRSTGRPTQDTLTADAVACRAWLCNRAEVDDSRLIYHGLSIGGAVAAQLADRHPPAALILESSFTSMVDITVRFGLVGTFCRHPFRTDNVISRRLCPLLLTHGRRDPLVPISHARRLQSLAGGARLVVREAGHDDYEPEWREMCDFLAQCGLLPPPP